MNELIWARNATQKNVLESYDDMQNHFKAGNAVFTWGSPPGFSAEDLAKFDQKQEDLSFMPLPGKDEGGRKVAFAGGEVWTFNPMNSKAENDAAWEVIQYLSYDPEYCIPMWQKQNELGRLNANPAPRTDMVETKYNLASSWPDHWAKQMADAFEMAQPEPFCPNWNDLKNEIVIPLQTIYLKEGISWDEAEELLKACAKTLCEKYPTSFRIP
jgi:ABC-type glycerol-3-phosphate transport system substrate-binding protein